MATSFAGARNLDDRRRRRLASETEENSVPAARRSRVIHKPAEQHTSRANVSIVALFPVRKLISPQIWKLSFICLVLTLLGGLIIFAGLKQETDPTKFGPGFAKLFSLENGRAANYFCGLLMTVAGQIAILIWWARSRSLHDYDGNFRVWVWTSTCAILFGLCMLTEAHVAFSLSVFWFWDLDFWKQDTLCWLGPALVITGGLFWQLRHDLYDCKTSRSFFAVATGCWIVSALLSFDMKFPGVENQQAAHAIVVMAGTLMFFMTMLFHARFVLYESAEAPASSQAGWREKVKSVPVLGALFGFSFSRLLPSKSLLSRLKPSLPKREKKEPKPKVEKKPAASSKKPVKQAKPALEKSVAPPQPEPDPTPAPVQKPAKKPRFRLKSQTVQEVEPESVAQPQPAPKTEPAPAPKPATVQQPQPEPAQEIEPFPSEDEFAGLSKKERRKLRRQRQQQARRAA